MPYDHDYVCMMKQPVLCELCNKSYAIGVMRPSKQPLMVRTFLKVYIELGSYYLFLQEQIKDIIIRNHHHHRNWLTLAAYRRVSRCWERCKNCIGCRPSSRSRQSCKTQRSRSLVSVRLVKYVLRGIITYVKYVLRGIIT